MASADQPTTTTTITTPQELATIYKRSGSFDALRRSLLEDFLASPDKAAFHTQLDALLPSLLSKPSFKRHAKRERPAELLAGVEREGILLKGLEESVESKLREGQGVEETLRRLLRGSRGEVEEEMKMEQERVVQEQQQPSSTFIPANPTTTTTTEINLLTSHTAPTSIREASSAPPPPTAAQSNLVAIKEETPSTSLSPTQSVLTSTKSLPTPLLPPSFPEPSHLFAPSSTSPSAPAPTSEATVGAPSASTKTDEATLDALISPLIASLGGASSAEASLEGEKLEGEVAAQILGSGEGDAAASAGLGVGDASEEVGMAVDVDVAQGEEKGDMSALQVGAGGVDEAVVAMEE